MISRREPKPDQDPVCTQLALCLGFALLAGLAFAGPGCDESSEPEALPVLGAIPSFQLVDQGGQAFDSNSLAGKVWVADFIFTNCPGACPVMTSHLHQLQQAIAREPKLAENVRLVSFSIDPARDTPEQLAAFAERYDAGPKTWHFLTGESGATVALSQEGFLLSASEGSPGTDSSPPTAPTHSNRFALVDGEGKLRGHYDAMDDKALAPLLRDLRSLVAEIASRQNTTTE